MKKFSFLVIIFSLFANSVLAQNMSIIRDAETENFLRDLTRPIFTAANLDPKDINIYIVNDDSLNAFVSGGQNVFINSGLITKYNTPDVLIGVIAHETGHITAGHLARSGEEMQNASTAMILTYLVGIAAAVSSNPDAGTALILGGNQMAQRSVLKFTRTQEEAADLLAVKYLEKMQYSPQGLLSLLQVFQNEEASYKGQIDEYALTHPVSQKRINFIKAQLKHNWSNTAKIDAGLEPRMKRIVVKLEAFLSDPNFILEKYQGSDNLSIYARAIANYKKGKINEAVASLDQLIAVNKNDAYLWDLKGEILFESGRIKDSVESYDKAVKIAREDKTLIQIAFATSIVALNSGDKQIVQVAIDNLNSAKISDPENPQIFKQLSNAYNQINDDGNAYLALAEFNLLIGNKDKASEYAKLASDKLNKNDKTAIMQAEDILAVSKKSKGDKNK